MGKLVLGAVLPFSFWTRAVFALGWLALLSGVELCLRGRRATRWRGAVVIAASAVLGACVGAAIDALTVTISAEYFAVHKGLGFAEGLRSRAVDLGSKAGLSAATLGSCALVYARVRAKRHLDCAAMLARVFHIAALAVAGGALLAACVASLDETHAQRILRGLLADPCTSSARSHAFFTTWAFHGGVYAGTLLGLVRAVRRP